MPYGGGGGPLGPVPVIALVLLFWCELITTGVVLTRRCGRGVGTCPGSPCRLLDERHARGEVDEREYRERRERGRRSS